MFNKNKLIDPIVREPFPGRPKTILPIRLNLRISLKLHLK